VISGVSAGALVPPGGISAIPLARIDIPVSTSAITNAMIHDLRQVANPQRIMQMAAASGPGSAQNWTVGTSGVIWPTTATFSVAIPVWATTMVLQWDMNDLLWQSGNARGFVNPFFGTNVAAPVLSMPQVLLSVPSATGPWRHSLTGATSLAIPPSLRGTTQTMNFKQVTDGTNTGIMAVDEGTQYSLTWEFQQLASAS
jgi:hypothetical protein